MISALSQISKAEIALEAANGNLRNMTDISDVVERWAPKEEEQGAMGGNGYEIHWYLGIELLSDSDFEIQVATIWLLYSKVRFDGFEYNRWLIQWKWYWLQWCWLLSSFMFFLGSVC